MPVSPMPSPPELGLESRETCAEARRRLSSAAGGLFQLAGGSRAGLLPEEGAGQGIYPRFGIGLLSVEEPEAFQIVPAAVLLEHALRLVFGDHQLTTMS